MAGYRRKVHSFLFLCDYCVITMFLESNLFGDYTAQVPLIVTSISLAGSSTSFPHFRARGHLYKGIRLQQQIIKFIPLTPAF